ncbi:MAG: DUF3577 domain-containing protein [Gammaproteobacteria bacterium]|nr:DUF3577 domain-containing protein [Gammaproteobacteria bacterium]MDE0252785.1 DUF3577 domain-containing protein [Gammaproteobacteria bacterium]MDE0402207.1 DUF3577 domain-containing protein [Gammaproteobacteria bacterium]MXX94411.1 DUF3577 domain-containing protein [Gammaproteobacteria bacterium]MYF54122.1 DUF3577 domain-containing protein [Gammaproteobacteria bacterium]
MATMAQAKQFALLTTGLGYLNQVRTIEPKSGYPFLAVTISALRGLDQNVRYTYFDCVVSGRLCNTYVSQLAPYVEAGEKVLVRFRIRDLNASAFIYPKGPKEGQPGVNVKAKLIGIDWARVNGVAFTEMDNVA